MRPMTLSAPTFDWWIGQLHPLRPGFWLLLSFGLSLLALVAGRVLPPHYRWWLRVGRWTLTPYLGLLVGGLSPRLMGLSGLDWVAGLGLGVGLIFAIWLFLALFQATLHREESDPHRPGGLPIWQLLTDAGAQEFHWTFLRGAVWELLLALPAPPELPGYWAVWLATALALPGVFAHPRQTPQQLIRLLLLLTTAVLFFYTRNFYLCWLLHASATFLMGQGRLSGGGEFADGEAVDSSRLGNA